LTTERRVWIAQCLCPSRHAILAAAVEANSEAEAKTVAEERLRETIDLAVGIGAINPWCGLCNARAETWRYEVARTRYRTLDEAAPALRQSEAEQAITRAAFGDVPRSD
jgi:hypothetical protein